MSEVSGFRFLYARILWRAMESSRFMVLYDDPYTSRTTGERGIEYVCAFDGRAFFLSESRTDEASPVERFMHVLKDADNLKDKPLIWPNRRGEDCLYLEATYLCRWYKFHTPLKKGPDDQFSKIISKVLTLQFA